MCVERVWTDKIFEEKSLHTRSVADSSIEWSADYSYIKRNFSFGQAFHI